MFCDCKLNFDIVYHIKFLFNFQMTYLYVSTAFAICLGNILRDI